MSQIERKSFCCGSETKHSEFSIVFSPCFLAPHPLFDEISCCRAPLNLRSFSTNENIEVSFKITNLCYPGKSFFVKFNKDIDVECIFLLCIPC